MEFRVQGVSVQGVSEFERVYREHGDRLWWALLAYSGSREIASDAVAEAFAQALARGTEIRQPLPWIWKAAFRLAAGELQHRGRHSPVTDDWGYEMPEPDWLFAALGRLSHRQRACLVLHYYAGYSYREIAAMLGTAVPTVGVHITRGRSRLRELLPKDRDD